MRAAIVAALLLAGCASTSLKGFVGQPIEEAMMRYGPPESVIDLPDGRKAFQFRWGQDPLVKNQGCLVTLIGKPSGNTFIVEEYRAPKAAVC